MQELKEVDTEKEASALLQSTLSKMKHSTKNSALAVDYTPAQPVTLLEVLLPHWFLLLQKIKKNKAQK